MDATAMDSGKSFFMELFLLDGDEFILKIINFKSIIQQLNIIILPQTIITAYIYYIAF